VTEPLGDLRKGKTDGTKPVHVHGPYSAVVLIATERLTLRRFRTSDAETLAAYRSDPEVARYQSWSAPYTLSQARLAVAGLSTGHPDEPGWFQYAIERTGDHTHIGDIGVNLHENRMQAEIGFTLATAHQGNGYATEAVHAVLDHLFGVRGLHKVSAECDARNHASARLLERLGFFREGHRRAHTWLKDEWTDDLLYGLLASDRSRS
jgi:RimJ/RimL family protein N-acetyltransferase